MTANGEKLYKEPRKIIKKRKQTVRNLKASKKAGKTKSNKRILKEYQSRYINGEREREQRATSTLLNSD